MLPWRAGAFGYSISRSLFHRVPDGRNVPGTWSDPSEFFRIAAPLAELGRGVLESAPRYNLENAPGDRVDEELAWMAEISRVLGRPFSFNLQQIRSLDDHYRRVIASGGRGQRRRAPAAPADHPPQRRRAVQLRGQHPDRRPAVVPGAAGRSTWPGASPRSAIPRCAPVWSRRGAASPRAPFEIMYLMPDDGAARYVYDESDSIAAIARRAGVSPGRGLPGRDGRAPTAGRSSTGPS